jgi:hypothetical protein
MALWLSCGAAYLRQKLAKTVGRHRPIITVVFVPDCTGSMVERRFENGKAFD